MFAVAKNALDSCHTFTGKDDSGHTITGTIGALSFPAYGDQSGAWRFDAKVQGLPLALDIVVARKGSNLVAFFTGGLQAPDTALLSRLMPVALAKVS
jgi:hypothetical protein